MLKHINYIHSTPVNHYLHTPPSQDIDHSPSPPQITPQRYHPLNTSPCLQPRWALSPHNPSLFYRIKCNGDKSQREGAAATYTSLFVKRDLHSCP